MTGTPSHWNARVHVNLAIVALASAGTHLLKAREDAGPQAQEMITGLRDDIQRMIGDAEALRQIVRD